jgi:hypothetical protein
LRTIGKCLQKIDATRPCHPELVSGSYLHPEMRFRTEFGMTPVPPRHPAPPTCHSELVSGSYLHPETRFQTASGMTPGLPCHPELVSGSHLHTETRFRTEFAMSLTLSKTSKCRFFEIEYRCLLKIIILAPF